MEDCLEIPTYAVTFIRLLKCITNIKSLGTDEENENVRMVKKHDERSVGTTG
jgi:hypothetical protein